MSFTNTQHQNGLVERILQRVCAMLNDPTHTIVLMCLQTSSSYKTEKMISEELQMPLTKVSTALQALKEERLIESDSMTERLGERRKTVYAYYINYKVAIENIVFKYAKIMTELNESRKFGETLYFCPKCQQRYTESEAIEYTDLSTGRLLCIECDMPLQNDTEDVSLQANSKLRVVSEQFKELREMLEMLQFEYHSTQDYPIYTRPVNETAQTVSHKRTSHSVRERNYVGGINGGFVTRIRDGPMPWEDDDFEQPVVQLSRTPMEVVNYDDLFENTVFMQNEFLHPDESFNIKETSFVPSSLSSSPAVACIPKCIHFGKRGTKRTISRSISALPQQY
ncbi:hypothetical protein EIN_498900 [Entamoeba invadens IP1]|uniref:Transcription initiation factor IIE subunit alpha N-terminal domain-containing protein n=1 Tax=Entamoeba invadens IP1 TaxID=370355 RepID=A0A0A1UGA1_ENTIV|nr:hypothetical protein EIN_498900 [Entamoeba invadens IP1]ELP94660.1 hypothetical protein EIN_498900 [Entamoeba invadens IP1]|eukprot:XP_004261431.1 hypothetical protein EIN_498900 [Entamoeba invadens IP1]